MGVNKRCTNCNSSSLVEIIMIGRYRGRKQQYLYNLPMFMCPHCKFLIEPTYVWEHTTKFFDCEYKVANITNDKQVYPFQVPSQPPVPMLNNDWR